METPNPSFENDSLVCISKFLCITVSDELGMPSSCDLYPVDEWNAEAVKTTSWHLFIKNLVTGSNVDVQMSPGELRVQPCYCYL